MNGERKWLSYTVYDRPSGEPTVGITFKPTPSMTKREVLELLNDLDQCWFELEAAGGSDD